MKDDYPAHPVAPAAATEPAGYFPSPHKLQGESEAHAAYKAIPIPSKVQPALGVATVGGGFQCLIAQGTAPPTQRAAVFTTVEDGQTEVAIKVLALDRGKTDLLSSFELAGLTPLRAGMAQIVVTFHLDEDLVLRVTAHDRLGNQTEQIYIRDRLPTPPHDARRS